MRSLIATIRSHTVETFNEEAKKMVVHAPENVDNKPKPKGSKRNNAILSGTRKQFHEIEKAVPENPDSFEKQFFSHSRDQQFKTERWDKTVTKVLNSRLKALNKSQSERRVAITPFAKKMVPYSKLLKIFIPNTSKELTGRKIIIGKKNVLPGSCGNCQYLRKLLGIP